MLLSNLLFYLRLVRDPRANYKQSLEVLRHVKRIEPNMVTKSSLMLGLGETDDEVLQAMKGKTKQVGLQIVANTSYITLSVHQTIIPIPGRTDCITDLKVGAWLHPWFTL